MATENPQFKPVPGEFVSMALVCRCVPVGNRYVYDGYEALLIPCTSWVQLQNSIRPLKEEPISGIPLMIVPVNNSLIIGTLMDRKDLAFTAVHKNQRNPVSFSIKFVVSIIFQEQDLFTGPMRLVNSRKLKKPSIMKFLQTMQHSAPVRTILDLETCRHTLDISNSASSKTLLWQNSVNHEPYTRYRYMYTGIMYLCSFKIINGTYQFQLCSALPPMLWCRHQAKIEIARLLILFTCSLP